MFAEHFKEMKQCIKVLGGLLFQKNFIIFQKQTILAR